MYPWRYNYFDLILFCILFILARFLYVFKEVDISSLLAHQALQQEWLVRHVGVHFVLQKVQLTNPYPKAHIYTNERVWLSKE